MGPLPKFRVHLRQILNLVDTSSEGLTEFKEVARNLMNCKN
jgi:hypothetical protein